MSSAPLGSVKVFASQASLRRRMRQFEVGAAQTATMPIDTGAWSSVVEEQRRLIAQAAGVSPSKVRIFVGN
jgi:hypothetical protein